MQSFTSTCSLPPEGTNFVSPPPLRGTLQILWTCLSVLILCTWSVVHLNVPPQLKARSKKQKFFRASKRLFSKVRWMLFNILAPEWIFAKSLSDFLTVRGLRARFMAQAEKDGVPWSNTHTHFAEMGGFAFSFTGLTAPQDELNLSHEHDKSFWILHIGKRLNYMATNYISKWLDTGFSNVNTDKYGWHIDVHNSELVAKALENWETDASQREVQDSIACYTIAAYTNLLKLRSDLWVPNAVQLLMMRELGLLDSLPHIDEDNLDDRNKGNVIIKAIAISQICWFDLQFLVRSHNGMVNTQLEVMVFAFTIFSIASYAFAWDRPKGAEYTIINKATNYARSVRDIIKIAAQGPVSYYYTRPGSTLWFANHQQSRGLGISALGLDMPELSFLVAGAATSIFGALHCIAWYFSFPSRAEQIMWQVSSITSIVCPILFTTLRFFTIRKMDSMGSVLLVLTMIILLIILFGAARIFILVEVFRSLGFQPPEAFISTWTANLPHIT